MSELVMPAPPEVWAFEDLANLPDDGRRGVGLSIAVYELSGSTYREVVVVKAGEQVEVRRPFRVVLDPARLIP